MAPSCCACCACCAFNAPSRLSLDCRFARCTTTCCCACCAPTTSTASWGRSRSWARWVLTAHLLGFLWTVGWLCEWGFVAGAGQGAGLVRPTRSIFLSKASARGHCCGPDLLLTAFTTHASCASFLPSAFERLLPFLPLLQLLFKAGEQDAAGNPEAMQASWERGLLCVLAMLCTLWECGGISKPSAALRIELWLAACCRPRSTGCKKRGWCAWC